MNCINVKKNLPCNHPEIIDIIRNFWSYFRTTHMQQDLNRIRYWNENYITYFMPVATDVVVRIN